MGASYGRQEVARLRARLDEVFKRAESIDYLEHELRSDMAKYICVLVSGYLEKAAQELATEWCRKRAHESVARFTSKSLERLPNLNGKRLKETLGKFSTDWSIKLEEFPEELEALNSIYSNRNRIAHGADVGLTLARIREYDEKVERLVQAMISLMDPAVT